MAGNVSEWCADWHDPMAYLRYKAGDLSPPAQGEKRAIRGGGWSQDQTRCRITFRDQMLPGYARFDGGFRVAKDAVP